jgi:HEAT repeat protein
VRYAAACALGEIVAGARSAVADLEAHAREDQVGDVRWIAAKSLRKLGVANARPGEPARGDPPEAR